MSLDPLPSHPGERCYLVKLHREAATATGEMHGRVEHLVSGDSFRFTNFGGLIAWLLQHDAAQQRAALQDQERNI